MKKYILTTEKLHGTLVVGFDANSLVVHFDNTFEMDEKGKRWLLNNFPWTEQHLASLKEKMNGQLEEVLTEVTFDIFWEKYGKKVNRKRAEAIWNKMKPLARMQAVLNLWVYDRYLTRTGFRTKADPSNYLSNEYFLTDWSKESK